MPAYSFQTQFAPSIIAGTKGGTIRAPRKNGNAGVNAARRHDQVGGHAYPGEQLSLYTGMRTKHCKLIMSAKCAATLPIELDFSLRRVTLWVDEAPLTIERTRHLDELARFDGFADFDEMTEFWRDSRASRNRGGDGTYFDGWHIRWLPLPAGLDL